MSNSKPEKQRPISRRDAIKVLSAAAGAAVIANLPADWETPIVEMGVLPAYAQTSPEQFTATFNASTRNPSAGGAFAADVYTWGTWAGGMLKSIYIFPVGGFGNWSNGSLKLTNSVPVQGSFAQTFVYEGDPIGQNMGAVIWGVDGTVINATDTIE